MKTTVDSFKFAVLSRPQFVFLIICILVIIPLIILFVSYQDIYDFWFEHVHAPSLQEEFGFKASHERVITQEGNVETFIITSVLLNGRLAQAGFEPGDIPVGYHHRFSIEFYLDLIRVKGGETRKIKVLRLSDYAHEIYSTRVLTLEPVASRGISPSNQALDQPGCSALSIWAYDCI